MNQIYRDIARETTQEALYDMGRAAEMYYGAIIHYLVRYMWRLEDNLPGKGSEIWGMFLGHPAG